MIEETYEQAVTRVVNDNSYLIKLVRILKAENSRLKKIIYWSEK